MAVCTYKNVLQDLWLGNSHISRLIFFFFWYKQKEKKNVENFSPSNKNKLFKILNSKYS